MKSKMFRILGVVAAVSMLAATLTAIPALAISSSGLTIVNKTISTATTYTLTFNLGATLPLGAAAITVGFPTGTTGLGAATATLEAGPGLGTGAVPVAAVVIANPAGTTNLTVTTVANMGAGAIVQLIFTGIINPPTVGDFTVTLKTATETTAITAGTFTTIVPVPPILPGVASVYNSAGVLMSTSNSLTTALGAVLAGGSITLTPGLYNTAFVGNALSCTIKGTTTAADVILTSIGAWAMNGATVVIDKVTIDGSTGVLTMTNATAGTVSNSVLKGAVLTMAGAGTNTVDTCAFTVLTVANGFANGAAATVKTSTFSVAGTGVGIANGANVTVSGCTFTGVTAAGIGIALTAGAANVIGTSTFTGLTTALAVTAPAAVAFNGNTVSTCGVTLGASAIAVTSTAGLSVTNCKITGSLANIINVAANDNLVVVMFNEFSGNVSSATNAGGVGFLNVTHNYWGGAAAPTSTATVSYALPLGKAATASSFAAALTLNATATARVNITASTASTLLGAGILTGIPVGVALPTTVTAVNYYDVFGVATTAATIQFYGTTTAPITASSAVYFYNTTFGRWDPAAYTVNIFGNYVEVTVGATPTAAQFVGLPFALVTINPTAPAAPPVAVIAQYPLNGAVAIPIDVTFTWPAVAGATSYDFVLAQELGQIDKFAIPDYGSTTPTNAVKASTDMKYNTQYWWRVRSVNSIGSSAWTVGTFTTAKEPAAVVTPTTTIIVPTQPAVTPTVIITTSAPVEQTPVIPSYLLWAVIAVGAVLVIVVIVLIVRTRRIS